MTRRRPRPARVLIAVIAALACGVAGLAEEEAPAYPGTYFAVSELNPHLPPRPESVDLSTPQAAVEHFLLSGRRDAWSSAAHALNFRLLETPGEDESAKKAEQLFFLINQNIWIDWSLLPDRPDGVDAGSLLPTNNPMIGQPRRSIRLGTIPLDGREIPIRVERVKPAVGAPVWLFSSQTVDAIGALYRANGPSWLAQRVPEWARERVLLGAPAWQWLAIFILIGLAILVGWAAAKLISRGVAAKLPMRGEKLIEAIKWPTTVFTSALVSYVAVGSLLTLPGPLATIGSPVLLVVVVLSGTWLPIRILGFAGDRIVRRISEDSELSVDESGALVKLTVFRYAIAVLIFSIGVSVILLSMELFRTLGIALLSSAGAMAVILGIAGREVLGNLIAGMQIAVTRPFRIGDTVIVEGFWGRIEEIRYTFVTVRTWDHKRIVFPVRYFIDHWFENWTTTDRFLVKAVYLRVDYRANVQAIREKFLEFVRNDEDWDSERDDPQALVTDTGDETMTLRLACGGPDSSAAWRLSCRVREKMLAWLQAYEGGLYLPRQRVELDDLRDAGGAPPISGSEESGDSPDVNETSRHPG